MASADGGWEWFAGASDSAPAPAQNDPSDIAASFARCFATPDGRRVIAALTEITLARALAPGASDAELRHLEGQRQLVAHIRSLIVRGNGTSSPSTHCPTLHNPSTPSQ